MKFFALALTVVGLASQLSISNTFADVADVKATQADRVVVTKAFIQTAGTSEFSTTIRVYAVATFSNACMAPDQLVTIASNEGQTGRLEILLGGFNFKNRMCTMEYKPVQKTVLVRELHTDIMPIVTVNGVRASLN